MNNNQRLFVTPEERARRIAEQNKHPHGGEGNCGGKEGHGTPELRKRVEEQGAKQNVEVVEHVSNVPATAKKSSAAVSSPTVGGKEQLRSALKLSIALDEPACRRNGMNSPFARRVGR